jgi:hypothetical protein
MLENSGEIITRHSTQPGNPGSKLARLAASSRKLAAREMSWPLVRPLVRPTVSAAFSGFHGISMWKRSRIRGDGVAALT